MRLSSRACVACVERPVCGEGPRAIYCEACVWLNWKFRERVMREVQRAIRLHELPPVSRFLCVDCGKPAVDYDHRDYLAPLAVEPLCRGCNLRRGPGSPFRDGQVQHFDLDCEGLHAPQ